MVKQYGNAEKPDESFDLFMRLGVDPKIGNQNIRGTVILPNGTGKDIKICVFAPDHMHEELTKLGADFFGTEEILAKAAEGEHVFDKILATTENMKIIKQFARQLGPMGLMPSTKGGTLVDEEQIANSLKLMKQGRIEFK